MARTRALVEPARGVDRSRHAERSERRIERLADGGQAHGEPRDRELLRGPPSLLAGVRTLRARDGARRFLVDAPERRSAAGGRGLEQRPIEDLEKPAAGDRPRVVMDENGGRDRVRDVTVDGGHAREGRVDGRAPAGVPTDQSVAEPDASGQLVYDLPRREHGPVALDAPALDPVAQRQGQIVGSAVVGSSMAVGGLEVPGDLRDHGAAGHVAVSVFDLRAGAGGVNLDGADLFDFEEAPCEPTADVGRGIGEEVATGDEHAAVARMGDRDVDASRAAPSRLRVFQHRARGESGAVHDACGNADRARLRGPRRRPERSREPSPFEGAGERAAVSRAWPPVASDR